MTQSLGFFPQQHPDSLSPLRDDSLTDVLAQQ